MKLRRVSLENFRGKQATELKLGSRLTLLMGENGSGKTTYLDAVAIALGAILTYLPKVSGITFRKRGDIFQCNGREAPYTRIVAESMEDGLAWDCLKRRDKSQRTTEQVPPRLGVRALRQYLDRKIIEPWQEYYSSEEESSFELPVLAYYGVSRAVLDVPMRRRGFSKNYTRFDSLADSLNATSRFRSAFIWFYNKENEELRLQQDKRDFDARLPELETVRRCISSLLPHVSNPRTDTNPLRFLVSYQGQEFEIDQLSGGYKTMLGLAMDLGRRMVEANPSSPDPLATEAIVLIDEVDLHLHPEWQQHVVSGLLRTFPHTQFILTSHSPILVESINNLLKRHAVDSLLTKIHQEGLETEIESDEMTFIKDLYPLASKDTCVYSLSKDNEHNEPENLLDLDQGLTGDTLIEWFNKVSATFYRMRDLEDDFESAEAVYGSSDEEEKL
ncbi:MAG: AAA family ATPase [Synechococcus sp. SB0666_bin_14]|nr:AAA family ATPase [Synechococcus sp. SB0666_bin_14]MYG46874.1 AAA family ATPase [Synechococcus sp. SB0675_bin_6]MYJ59527.1 AAA family ATPase [Synechococcus sp. SB0672_bin_6]